MKSLPNPQAARDWCDAQRARQKRIGFVATMGALHRGHLSLVERAARENDATCASIFVNPLQFDDAADLAAYPRDRARDFEVLEGAGCDMVFGGELGDFFADADDIKLADPGVTARGLEGDYRPGHLPGVRAIVEKLFAAVGSCTAYFGEKDFQQTRVIQALAAEMDGVKIAICPTVREPNGLALSSRNRRLTAAQKAAAADIYQALLRQKTLGNPAQNPPPNWKKLCNPTLQIQK